MPLYCETPALITRFPAEPINTWSNLFIVAVGIVAWIIVARAPLRGARFGLYLLSFFLIATGAGSLLWHGFRTEAFLVLDVLPGALFLLTFTYLWLRRFYSKGFSILALTIFIIIEALSIAFGDK